MQQVDGIDARDALHAVGQALIFGVLPRWLENALIPGITKEITRLARERDQLTARVAEQDDEIARLRRELERRARYDPPRASSGATESDRLHRRVGLSSSAPEWVVRAVRRTYRSRLHPDRHAVAHKKEAERRFKQAEETFDRIWRTRGFKS